MKTERLAKDEFIEMYVNIVNEYVVLAHRYSLDVQLALLEFDALVFWENYFFAQY